MVSLRIREEVGGLADEVEYRNKSLTKIFGSPYLGCYALAVAIFSLGLIRDAL
jgi:hypothetical protein